MDLLADKAKQDPDPIGSFVPCRIFGGGLFIEASQIEGPFSYLSERRALRWRPTMGKNEVGHTDAIPSPNNLLPVGILSEKVSDAAKTKSWPFTLLQCGGAKKRLAFLLPQWDAESYGANDPGSRARQSTPPTFIDPELFLRLLLRKFRGKKFKFFRTKAVEDRDRAIKIIRKRIEETLVEDYIATIRPLLEEASEEIADVVLAELAWRKKNAVRD